VLFIRPHRAAQLHGNHRSTNPKVAGSKLSCGGQNFLLAWSGNYEIFHSRTFSPLRTSKMRVYPIVKIFVQIIVQIHILFKFSEIRLGEVIHQLRTLKISKWTGLDNIPAKALKLSADIIGPLLTWIFNLSI
jgi:hypothetical protein